MNSTRISGLIKPEFSVRIVVCDHYLTRPIPGVDVIYSDFRGSDIKQVPVLRIFGSAPDGHKACLHVHGVFPYFYIPCPTAHPPPQFLYQVAASLDKALNIALKQATSANQHVYKISLVKGLPFYGFHDKDHLYLKVFLYNPGLIKQAVELCSNGAILGQTFQPHESHVNFTLQFFIDFNLFGMSNIDLQAVKFRKSGLSQNSNDILQDSDECCLKAESICHYEADCVASHIINRQRIGKGDGIENPGLEEVWNQEKERRRQLNVSMGSKTLSQERVNIKETETHKKFEQMFHTKISDLINKPASLETKDLDVVHYPAESMVESQLLDAVDVSMHLPDKTSTNFDETVRKIAAESLYNDPDETLVDESVALNSSLSLHYSQVLLNSEDFELLDLLQDMDEKPLDEDSVMRSPADVELEADEEVDDAEYSQVYLDDTIVLEPNNRKDESENTLSWNDSFWDGVNIPQLDGTFDDEHVKKVRKRKMRPLKVGLSRPKSQKNENNKLDSVKIEQEKKDTGCENSDEINESQETVKDVLDSQIHRVIKCEIQSVCDEIANNMDSVKEESITSLVRKHEMTSDNDIISQQQAKSYDKVRQFVPEAGPSNVRTASENNCDIIDSSFNESFKLCDNKLGIESFYISKVFDETASPESINELKNQDANQSDEKIDHSKSSQTTPKLYYSEDDIQLESKVILTPMIRPPTKNYIIDSLEKYNIPKIKNPIPYFSDYKDVGEKVEVGQLMLKLLSKSARDQKPFGNVLDVTSLEEWRQLLFLQTNETSEETTADSLMILLAGRRQCILQPVARPPTRSQVIQWINNSNKNKTEPEKKVDDIVANDLDDMDNSQTLGLNEDNINCSIGIEVSDKEVKSNCNSMQASMQPDGSFLCFGNGESENSCTETPTVGVDFLTVMLMEIHTAVRSDLHPDPALDAIQAVFVQVTNDCPPNHFLTKSLTEIIVVDNSEGPKHLDRCIFNSNVSYVESEIALLNKIIEMVKLHDPDIMCGYEIEMNSWGYFLERSQLLGFETVQEISRITEKHRQKRFRPESDDFERRIIGRIIFNVWRLFRHELALSSYSFENCMYEILKERVPTHSYAQLAAWWTHQSRVLRWIPVEYYLMKLSGTVRMLEKLDFINRTSELARLFGLQWWEVLSRGSQLRVESLMLRAARPLNLVALSPSVAQRAGMRAPECLPLIFEPESRFYTDPVIVLDFQSLYPSIMIAYNYCFSTCIGRVQNINGESAYEFGAWRLRIPKAKLEALVKNDLVHWSPVGAGFVKASVRRGVLPALLRRILAARQAVKKGMKLQKDEAIKKAMHSRQLGLKLIANVTYGYTAANFSGRMPCVELGDSVVAKGRETLERAVLLVRNSSWNTQVIYGDTDSLFVRVPGGTRADAFRIGQLIADAVTADNPSPVALKLEKVYQPCILQTKKRYVGYMYESNEQESPVFEAKGIETVRRDGCPAGVKMLRRALCCLFSSGDMSAVKRGVVAQLAALAAGRVPLPDLLFSREYRGPASYRPGVSAPPNEIAKRLCAHDSRARPVRGWRVQWAVAAGEPRAPLLRLARAPQELRAAAAPPAPLVPYYATRVLLPPLHRCLSLLGADVFKWWQELGYTREVQQTTWSGGGITRFMWRARCVVCAARGPRAVCAACGARPAAVLAGLAARAAAGHADRRRQRQICDSCCGHDRSSECVNTECPALWAKKATEHKLDEIREIVHNLPHQFCKETLDF